MQSQLRIQKYNFEEGLRDRERQRANTQRVRVCVCERGSQIIHCSLKHGAPKMGDLTIVAEGHPWRLKQCGQSGFKTTTIPFSALAPWQLRLWPPLPLSSSPAIGGVREQQRARQAAPTRSEFMVEAESEGQTSLEDPDGRTRTHSAGETAGQDIVERCKADRNRGSVERRGLAETDHSLHSCS